MPPKKPAVESRREREEKELAQYDSLIGEVIEFGWDALIYCGYQCGDICCAADYVDVYQGGELVAEGEPEAFERQTIPGLALCCGCGDCKNGYIFRAHLRVKKKLRGFGRDPLNGRLYAIFYCECDETFRDSEKCRVIYYVNSHKAYEERCCAVAPPYVRVPFEYVRTRELPPSLLGAWDDRHKMEAIREGVDRWGV